MLNLQGFPPRRAAEIKSVSLIIGAAIVILLLGGVLSAINEFRSTDVQESYDVTTAANVTSTAVAIVHELFGDNTISAEVSSNLTADAPIPYSYVANTQVLTITGLEADNTRRLTLDYLTDGLWDYPGASIAASMWPIMLVLGVIGLIVAAVISASRHGE